MTWIIDHTIQVGRKKALVILRVPVDFMKNKRALNLQDVEVVSMVLRDKWTGDDVETVMKELAPKIGNPVQIISDSGSDIKNGINKFSEDKNIHITRDISHVFANILKKKYDGLQKFHDLIKILTNTKSKLQQSKLSHLIPPTMRSKARFMNLATITKWAKTMLDWKGSKFDLYPEESNKHFAWIPDFAHFFQHLDREISTFNKMQKIIKTEGLDESTYKKCQYEMDFVGLGPMLRKPVEEYLTVELEFSRAKENSTNICSDIIESLFGAFKQHANLHAMSEINKLSLIIPCICANLKPEIIEEAFNTVSSNDVTAWIKKNASGTLLSKRRNLFNRKYLEEEVARIGQKAS